MEAENLDESVVKVGRSKESLELLGILRLGLVTDDLDLPLVHLNTICSEDVTEELDSGAVKFTLLQLQVEVNEVSFMNPWKMDGELTRPYGIT